LLAYRLLLLEQGSSKGGKMLPKKPRNSLYWLALPLLAAVVFYAAKQVTFKVKAYAQISTTPFVAETATYSFKDNPQGELFLKQVTARLSDGSTAEVSRQGPVWGASRRSVTLLSGMTFHAFDLISSKTSFKMKPEELAALKERLTNPPADCLFWPNAKVIGREALFGQEVVVLTHPLDKQKITYWMAPQLVAKSCSIG
jgi:hypothetical protein